MSFVSRRFSFFSVPLCLCVMEAPSQLFHTFSAGLPHSKKCHGNRHTSASNITKSTLAGGNEIMETNETNETLFFLL